MNKSNSNSTSKLTENLTNNEKSICKSIQKLINIFLLIDDDKKFSEKDRFYEKFRILREIYYLIDYYDLKNNRSFTKFIIVVNKKAEEFIQDLKYTLKDKGRIRPTNENRNAIIAFIIEMENFITPV